MRCLVLGATIFTWIFLTVLSSPPQTESRKGDSEIEARQLGPLGLTILGALTLPILIPVGVARLVGRLTNLGNSTTSTVGVTVRPVILPGRPLRLPYFGNPYQTQFRRRKRN